jgi:hypothetical protein
MSDTRTTAPAQALCELPFDYTGFAPALVDDLRATSESIRKSIHKSLAKIVAIGNELIFANDKIEHGSFVPWVEKEIGIPIRTAQNYMNAARFAAEHKNEIISFLPPTTIYRLAAPGVPAEIVDHVLARAQAGEIVTDTVVRETIKDAKQKQQEAKKTERRALRRTSEYKSKQESRIQKEKEKYEHERRQREAAADAIAREFLDRIGAENLRWFHVNSETDYWMVLDAIKKIVADDVEPSERAPTSDVGESAEQRKAEAAADEASA